jgi:hypothetical protein
VPERVAHQRAQRRLRLTRHLAHRRCPLVRSLRLEDDHPRGYRKTASYFMWSTMVLVLGLLLAAIDSAAG